MSKHGLERNVGRAVIDVVLGKDKVTMEKILLLLVILCGCSYLQAQTINGIDVSLKDYKKKYE